MVCLVIYPGSIRKTSHPQETNSGRVNIATQIYCWSSSRIHFTSSGGSLWVSVSPRGFFPTKSKLHNPFLQAKMWTFNRGSMKGIRYPTKNWYRCPKITIFDRQVHLPSYHFWYPFVKCLRCKSWKNCCQKWWMCCSKPVGFQNRNLLPTCAECVVYLPTFGLNLRKL